LALRAPKISRLIDWLRPNSDRDTGTNYVREISELIAAADMKTPETTIKQDATLSQG